MDMRARTEAMRALAYCTAACMDRARHHPDPAVRAPNQGRVELLTPVVKGWCTESSILIASTGIQVHGGMGYSKEFHVERYFREARLMRLAPISQEMVLNYVGEHVLGLPRSY